MSDTCVLAATNIPIAMGTEYTPFGLRTMLVEGLVDYLIIDSTWAGGLTTTQAATGWLYHVRGACDRFTYTPWPSPTVYFGNPSLVPCDPLWFELFRGPEIVDGHMTLPDTPGLGLELRDDTLEKYGVKIG
jgi:L-alanine-DL-glutamate epimerase-like enolase superfamily enzyme